MREVSNRFEEFETDTSFLSCWDEVTYVLTSMSSASVSGVESNFWSMRGFFWRGTAEWGRICAEKVVFGLSLLSLDDPSEPDCI